MDPIAAARALAPRIAAEADRIDREMDVGAELTAVLCDAGLFRLLVPRKYGGAELDLPTHLEVIETIARADASTAWCIHQAANFARNACTCLPSQTAQAVFGDARAIVANGPYPGDAASEGDGYRISGRWNFSTGCKNATYLSALCRVDGGNVTRTMLLPKEQAEIVEVWSAAGLRGTGTHHFVVNDVFVPHAFSFQPATDSPRETGTLYRFGSQSVFAMGFATVALGTARAALDAIVDLAGAKTARLTAGLLREQPLTQLHVGRAEAQLRAGRGLLWDTVARTWTTVCLTGDVDPTTVADIRLATTHAFHAARDVVDAAYHLGGATAVFAESPLQRRFQDMHAISQHIQARESHFQSVGRVLMGLEPGAEPF